MLYNITDKFIDEIYSLSEKDLTQKEINSAKSFLIDYIGVTLAGAYLIKDKLEKIISFFDSFGQSTALGLNNKQSVQSSIYLNGISSHIAELDDGVIQSSVHPGAPLFSVLIPVAEKEKVSSVQFLKGIVLGYEAIIRLANTVQPSHKKKGYHATATCGSIGSALGLAVMLNMSKKEMKNAFSSAIISAAGTLKSIENDSQLKPVNVANAALNAYLAVATSFSGFSGPDDPLSGKRGFLNVMSNEYNVEELFSDNKTCFSIEKVYVKPYAACRYCHPSIDAAFAIMDKIKNINEIKEVEIETYELAVFNHDHTIIKNISSAKMSIPFSFSLALIIGSAGIEDFSENNINSQSIIDLTKKIKVTSNKEFTKNFPKKSECLVKVLTVDGHVINKKINFPLGEPENPINQESLKIKFNSLGKFSGLSQLETKNILDKIFNIEEKLNELFPLL